MSVSHIREGLLQEETDKKFYLKLINFLLRIAEKIIKREKRQYADLVPI